MTTTAQHDHLKNEQGWTLTIGTATHLQSQWSEGKAQQLAEQAGIQLSEAANAGGEEAYSEISSIFYWFFPAVVFGIVFWAWVLL